MAALGWLLNLGFAGSGTVAPQIAVDRIIAIPSESRAIPIEQESRTYAIKSETRTIPLEPDSVK